MGSDPIYFPGTSTRIFFLWPPVLYGAEAVLQGGWPRLAPWGLPLLAWGFLQYFLSGRYRTRLGGGGPGLSVPPERLVTTGPYRYTRNPMYLGHLIFLAGLAVSLASWIAVAVLVFHVIWFDRRVRKDERRMAELFGAAYTEYRARVKRWIPGIV